MKKSKAAIEMRKLFAKFEAFTSYRNLLTSKLA